MILLEQMYAESLLNKEHKQKIIINFLEKLIIINSNEKYLEWINSFNWKNNKPIIQKYVHFKNLIHLYMLIIITNNL